MTCQRSLNRVNKTTFFVPTGSCTHGCGYFLPEVAQVETFFSHLPQFHRTVFCVHSATWAALHLCVLARAQVRLTIKNVTSPLCSSPPRSFRYSGVQKRHSLCKTNLQERANKRATLCRTGGCSLACNCTPALWLVYMFLVCSQIGLNHIHLFSWMILGFAKSFGELSLFRVVCFD